MKKQCPCLDFFSRNNKKKWTAEPFAKFRKFLSGVKTLLLLMPFVIEFMSLPVIPKINTVSVPF